MHFTLPSYCGNRAFSASRLSPWMIMFSLSLFSVCCPCSSKLYWPLQHPEGSFLMMVHDFIFTDSFQGWHGVFLQSKNFKLRKKRTHCCGKQGVRIYKRHFCVAKCLLGCAQSPSFCTVPMQAARFFKTLLFIYGRVSRQLRSAILMETSQAKRTAGNGLNGK